MLLLATVFAFPPDSVASYCSILPIASRGTAVQQAHKILRLTVFWRTRRVRTQLLPLAVGVPLKNLRELGITFAAADRALDQIDPPFQIGESGSPGACGPEQGRGGLRALGLVRAAATAASISPDFSPEVENKAVFRGIIGLL